MVAVFLKDNILCINYTSLHFEGYLMYYNKVDYISVV